MSALGHNEADDLIQQPHPDKINKRIIGWIDLFKPDPAYYSSDGNTKAEYDYYCIIHSPKIIQISAT
jgi:hypothetical protein